MKIAYISVQDSTNIRSFSGTGYYIPESLKLNGSEVYYIGNLKFRPYIPEKINELYFRHVRKKRYWFNRSPRVIKNYGKQVQRKLKETDPDVLLSFSGIPLALLKTDKPIVLWADAVFADIIDFYPEFSNMAKNTIKNGHKMEKAILDKCAHIVYSSEWAARGAMENYGIPREKIDVIPYGANIDINWNYSTVKEIIESKKSNHCKLLFVGVDWQRKGGNKAIEVANILHSKGIPTELHLLGSKPDDNRNLPSYVKAHGFVSKETKAGKQLIHELIHSSHFLILPTMADCTPIVFAEFNSYGIPCLTTKVGGIPTVIKDGKNGKLFDRDAPAEDYADYIKSLFDNYQDYKKLAYSSYKEYTERLNWQKSGEKMMEVLKKVVNKKHDSNN
jgi:glycosyltransferase involved in cell wall biosynthesis